MVLDEDTGAQRHLTHLAQARPRRANASWAPATDTAAARRRSPAIHRPRPVDRGDDTLRPARHQRPLALGRQCNHTVGLANATRHATPSTGTPPRLIYPAIAGRGLRATARNRTCCSADASAGRRSISWPPWPSLPP